MLTTVSEIYVQLSYLNELRKPPHGPSLTPPSFQGPGYYRSRLWELANGRFGKAKKDGAKKKKRKIDLQLQDRGDAPWALTLSTVSSPKQKELNPCTYEVCIMYHYIQWARIRRILFGQTRAFNQPPFFSP